MKQAALLLLLGLVLCSASNEHDLFLAFAAKYRKHYFLSGDTQEYSSRFEIFKNNLHYISQYNAQNNGVTLAVNQFADLTREEFASKLAASRRAGNAEFAPSSVVDPPPTFDWRAKGVVGPVRNEGECGSAYLFSLVDSISSIYAIETKSTHTPLDPEQVEKCATDGCDGGDPDTVLAYIQKHGIAFNFTEGDCPKGKVESGVCITGDACVAPKNEDALAEALVEQGPLVVNIDASLSSFMLYDAGVYNPHNCSTTELDHSLLVVGYTADAWICQNSWGTTWGIQGYVLIAKGNNTCGIAEEACYPTGVAKC